MGLDPKLLEILACPNCKGEVKYVEADEKIYCRGTCNYIYLVKDGIPVLLIDEAIKPG